MDNRFLILTESCCDLPPDRVAVPDVEVVPLTLTVGNRNYKHFLDERELKSKAFFDMLRRKETASTAAPSVSEFADRAEPYLQQGMDVLYISFDAALSATYATGVMALRELKQKYPMREILMIDSVCGSLGEGLMVEMSIQARAEGKSLQECAQLVEQHKLQVAHVFTVDDLHHLRRGGRLTSYAAMLGSVLQFKPIIALNEEGRLHPVDRVRGMRSALRALAQTVIDKARDLGQQMVYIAHGDSPDRALELEGLLKQAGAKLTRVCTLGPVIGAHGGPGALAVFFHAVKR